MRSCGVTRSGWRGIATARSPRSGEMGLLRISSCCSHAPLSVTAAEAQRGLAHYLEHMAFNGTANFPPGSIVPFFQSLGMAFGRDQNAFTGFDQTTYTLTLPGGGRELLDKGMLYMADVAMRMSLEPAEIDSERQIILEEKRARSSARQRGQDQFFERLGPPGPPGRGLPLGVAPTVKAGTGPGFQ